MTIGRLAFAALMLLGVAACVATSDASSQAAQGGTVSEVALGFWHGLIAPIIVIAEIIEAVAPTILPWTFRIYETQNTGVLYDVGFLVGLLLGPSLLWSSRRGLVRA